MGLSDLPCLAVSDSQKWVVIVLGAITVFYVIFRPMLRKRSKDPLQKMPSIGLAQQRAVEGEMQNLLVELAEMSRQLTAQLDTRSTKLQMLIEDADHRIAELKRMTEPRPESPAPAAQPVRAADDRYVRIYELADAGRSAQQIAQELARPQGEIELILALRQRQVR